MNRTSLLSLALGVLSPLLGGCHSPSTFSGDAVVKPLSSPYTLRLTLDRRVASPGEHVTAFIEFENTGRADLWIPRHKEVFFGFSQEGPISTSSESWTSSCEGLEYRRVRPGQKVKYEKEFPAPGMDGEISVYVTADRNVKAPLLVRMRLAPPGSRDQP